MPTSSYICIKHNKTALLGDMCIFLGIFSIIVMNIYLKMAIFLATSFNLRYFMATKLFFAVIYAIPW